MIAIDETPEFLSPSFLQWAVQHNLLSESGTAMDAYVLHGEIIKHPLVPYDQDTMTVLNSLSARDLLRLKEDLAHVIHFRSTL